MIFCETPCKATVISIDKKLKLGHAHILMIFLVINDRW